MAVVYMVDDTNICIQDTDQEHTESEAIITMGLSTLDKDDGILAMTLADPGAAGRKLVITQKDSGNQGHTVTAATAGAFDGTNHIATFDAQFETLVLYSVSATRWVVVENIGGVVLSAE